MNLAERDRSLWSDLLRFGVSGGITAAVDVGVLITLAALGTPLAAATTAAFFAALLVNFVTTRFLLGRHSEQRMASQLGRYLVLLAFNYALTLALVVGAAEMGIHYLIGKAIAIVLTAAVSFVAYRFWVFA